MKRENGYEQAGVHNAHNWASIISKYMGSNNFYFHSCRHYWCTELKRQKLPDDVIKELQGWSSDMISTYSDLSVEETLADYFDENGVKTDIKQTKLSDL